MNDDDNPFRGGCETVEDRLRLVRTACIETLERILRRSNLQGSVRAAAEKRLRRLRNGPG